MFLILILNLFVIASNDNTDSLSTTSGDIIAGRLTSIDEDSLRWEGEEGEATLDLASVERVALNSGLSRVGEGATTFQVHLVDGSVVVGTTLATDADTIRVTSGERVFSMQRRNVDGIRFFEQPTLTQEQRQELDEAWNATGEELSEDVLSLRKLEENESGVEVQTFSNFEGIIESIDAENVQFQFGGDSVPVKRERIAYVRYYHPAGRTLPEPSCLVQLGNGTSVRARSVLGTRDSIQVTSSAGAQFELSADELAGIDFAYGRVVYLGDLAPVTAEWSPFFRSATSGELLEELHRYRTNQAFDGKPLSLFSRDAMTQGESRTSNVQEFSRGLALRSESRLIFPASQKYSRFAALAGIDPAVRPRGNIELIIRGDGEILFQAQIAGTDPEPTPIDVSIEGVRRLSIEVGFGEQLDIGDQLNLCRARMIK